MSFILNIARDDLLAGLSAVQGITTKKGTMPILANVLLESVNDGVILTATDLEIGVKKKIAAEIISPGTITLPAKKFFEIIRELSSEQIHLEIMDNSWAKITDDSSFFRLAGMEGDEFPEFPDHKEENIAEISSEYLLDLINKTIFSVAQDSESQFTLTGILIEKIVEDGKKFLNFASSDGHRLSLMKREIEGDIDKLKLEKTTIIPRKGMQEIRRLCDENAGKKILFGVEKKQAVFKTDDTLYIIRLMNGDFPQFKSIIDIVNRDIYFEIDRMLLLSSVKRMSLFADDEFNIIKFNLENDKLLLSSESMDVGDAKEEIAIDFSAGPISVGFNGRYFLDTLQIMQSEKIKIFISSQESPCLIESELDPDFISIIMPMHI
jgi:DNA polymerase-3 subunit beta